MNCLSAIVKRRKAKEDKFKRLKEELGTAEESNENHNELRDTSNGDPNSQNETPVHRETNAATRIQAAFRSFLVRKILHNLKKGDSDEDEMKDQAIATSSTANGAKGSVRFHELVEYHKVRGQAVSALNHIHLWTRIQDQIRVRRLCMVKETRIKQKKLESQLKLEAKLHELEVEWCGGSETMEEIISRIQQREEASIKRERAMAYAFVHQWRANSSQTLGQTSFCLGKENWGWSWVERWVAARPWEIRVVSCPVNVKNAHTKLSMKPEKPILMAQDSTASNDSCKNRKSCATHPLPI